MGQGAGERQGGLEREGAVLRGGVRPGHGLEAAAGEAGPAAAAAAGRRGRPATAGRRLRGRSLRYLPAGRDEELVGLGRWGRGGPRAAPALGEGGRCQVRRAPLTVAL